MLKDVEVVVAARTTQDLWRHYSARIRDAGFPYVSYHAIRILEVPSDRLVDDSMLLSSHPPRLLQDLVSRGLFESVPMYRWMASNRGSQSWSWMQKRRQAGRLTTEEERALDLFARYSHTAGYAISLSDSVLRVRGGVIMTGEIGTSQEQLDLLWKKSGRYIEALTGLLHLRLSTLPYAEPDEVLTLRQREVLEHISIGRTTQEIAELLSLTPGTVEKHLRLARKALGARTTAQAILMAASRRQIFVDPGEACTVQAQSGTAGGDARPESWRFSAFPSTAHLYLRGDAET